MPVSYDGVGGKGGNLFEGLKLWISRRVPSRSKWVDLVKGNGGEVVALEKKADMLIADHLKKGGYMPPAGSYSWQWIDFSVKNGFLQHKDDYLIARPEGASRDVGSAEATKRTRTRFTSKDDSILAKWVLSRKRMGADTKGNAIYKQLEKDHPHHPWQSWRDRWVKKVSSMPHPNLCDEDLEIESEVGVKGSAATAPAAEFAEPAQPAKPAEHQAVPSTRPSRTPMPSASPYRKASAGRGRTFFSKEDDMILLEYIREAKENYKPLRGNKIYQQLAEEHPNHSWHSWRDRWLRHLSLREEEDNVAAEPEEAEGPASEGPQPRLNGSAPRLPRGALAFQTPQTTSARDNVGASETASPGNSIPGRSSTAKLPNPKSDEQRLKGREQARKKARAVNLLQKTWRGHAVRRDLAELETAVVSLQSRMRGYLMRERKVDMEAEALATGQQPIEDDPDEDAEQYEDAEQGFDDEELGSEELPSDDQSPKDQFYSDLRDYIKVIGVEIEGEPSIDGRRIDLWDLFRAVTQQDCKLEERDWKGIAEELDFDWVKSPIVGRKLLECYQRNLAVFEEATRSFISKQEIEGEGDERMAEVTSDERGRFASSSDASDAVTAPKEPSADPPSLAYRSSPPIAGLKRPSHHTEVLTSDLDYPSDRSRKRRRLDYDSEILQTPEEKLGLSSSSSGADRDAAHDKSSPLKSRGVAGEPSEMDSDKESEELLDEVWEDVQEIDELPDHNEPPRRKNFDEPETQDWRFTAVDDHEVRESIEDATPSQQLWLESDASRSSMPPASSRQDAPQAASSRPPVTMPEFRPTAYPLKRVLKSDPKTVVIQSPVAPSAQSGHLDGKATKRMLPQQYQRKPFAPAAAQLPAPVPTRYIAAKPWSQPNSSAPVSPANGVTARKTNSAVPQARQFRPSAPTQAISSSSAPSPLSSRRAPAPLTPARPLLPNRTEPSAVQAAQTDFDEDFDDDFDEDYVEGQIEHFMSMGYNHDDTMRAIRATSFQRGPMGVALPSLRKHRRLPPNERGVWTDLDDEHLKKIRDCDRRREKGKFTVSTPGEERLQAEVERYRARLTAKHGDELIETRQEFMELMNMVCKGFFG